MDIIEVKNLNFTYDNIHTLKIDTFNIESGSIVCISGGNSTFKTTFLKILGGFIKTENIVKIDNNLLNSFNSEKILEEVGYLFQESSFFSKTVYDELIMVTDGINKKGKIKKLLRYFNMEKYINKSPSTLSYSDSQKLSLIKILLKKPKIIFLDNPFFKLDRCARRNIFINLKNYAKKNDITIVSTLNTLEDTDLYERLVVIDNGNIILDDEPINIYGNDKILSKIGLKVPQEHELLEKLKLYGLIDEKLSNIDELVNEL